MRRAKQRGKGAPKKKRTKEGRFLRLILVGVAPLTLFTESKKFNRGKKKPAAV